MAFVQVGDVRLFYTDEGSGDPPFLLVHGYTCDSHDWSWQIPHLVSRHRVIAVDLRGHGRSSAPAEGYHPISFAADLAAALEQLSCPPVIAMGHSLGGVVVSALAVEHPERVRAVVSVDPGYLVDDAAKDLVAGIVTAMRAAPAGTAGAQAAAMLSGTYSAASPAPLRTWHLRRATGLSDEVAIATIASLMEGPGAVALRANSEPYLRRRACPVLAFYTDATRSALEGSLCTHPASKMVTWEGSGHWLHQERPAEFNAVVDAWVASLPA